MSGSHRKVDRLLAALGDAERAGRGERATCLALRALREMKAVDGFASRRRAAESIAANLLQTDPSHPSVRRFWRLGNPGRELVPLLRAQVVMFGSVPPVPAPVGPLLVGNAPPPSFLVHELVASKIRYIADARSYSCVCRDAAEATPRCSRDRLFRSRPLSWNDVVFAHRHNIIVLLPGGGTLCSESVKQEVATEPRARVHDDDDVFECMLRSYAAGRAGREVLVDGSPVAGWVGRFGFCLGQGDYDDCSRLVEDAPCAAFRHEALNAVVACACAHGNVAGREGVTWCE